MMKKRLVFHFYCDGDWKENEAVKLHLHCIKYFSHLFDDIVITIASDNAENKPFLANIKRSLIDYIDCPSITLKTAENTAYREGKTFYDEVVNSDYDGITFFCHTKGYTNISNSSYNKEYIIDWILGGYWLSLNFVEEAERCLTFSTPNNNSFFFGSFSYINRDGTPYLRSIYSGAFYWTNMKLLRHEFLLDNKSVPSLTSRMYAEEFPGLCYAGTQLFGGSHGGCRVYRDSFDFYGKTDLRGPLDAIEFLSQGGAGAEKYEDFKAKIIKNAGF